MDTWHHITPCTTTENQHNLTGLRIIPRIREKHATHCALKGRIDGNKFEGEITITTNKSDAPGAVLWAGTNDRHHHQQDILNTIAHQLTLDNNPIILREIQRITNNT
jgi:hypothetical protein